MSDFKRSKALLLNWLANGHTIRLSSEPSPSWGFWSGIESFPGQFKEQVVFRAVADGDLQYRTVVINGRRNEEFFVTDTRR